ncbi:type II toxin-antitoxin system RelE/ParE family toxin [Sansalvadorimonas verongulae]|uniref:type II toxin-antitoxin system RelE/ParE family toxin n=1 Tax=Sansalvadorimonas verongulae TaxID=2172824 RepID=UPI0012BCF7D5|nr:type II toxin-antitoxin system RelE/ParE family toxin [Sansalvadorimonas verongulae]MTI12384.1 type II toxin-antitoxin system RelE/ParE family toxin [Sansalvadorimonas verongulae]
MPAFALTRKAKSDLLDIARYTQETWGREQRNQYLAQLDKTFHLLAEKPSIGKACDAIREGYRKFPLGRHIIFYTATGGRVRVIRILHKSMDIKVRLDS